MQRLAQTCGHNASDVSAICGGAPRSTARSDDDLPTARLRVGVREEPVAWPTARLSACASALQA